MVLIGLPLQANGGIGQSFILTLPETNDQRALSTWLQATKPAGVMLLASHVKSRAKTKALTRFLQNEAKKLKIYPLIIAVDWEGGIVSRPTGIDSGFHPIPSPWLLAKLGRQASFQAGLLIGRQMHDVGITMDFAPSLDLFGKKILATRCFAADEQMVATCGIAFAKGLMHAGVMPVIKHFPGLGFGQADTHDEQITIMIDEEQRNRQIEPFTAALQASIPAIMCTHGIYESFGNKPVTRSDEVVKLLRANNPNVLLITDDFMMKAAWGDTDQEAAINEALQAGYDYVILSAKPAEQVSLVQRCAKKAYKKHHNQPKKKQLCVQAAVPFDEKRLAEHLAVACLQSTFVPPLRDKKIIMITTNLPIIRPPEQWFLRDDQSYLHQALVKRGANVIDEFVLDPKSKDSHEQLADVIALSKRHPRATIIVQTFFYADAIWNSIQQQWLEMLKPLAKNIVTISLGHPEEVVLLPTAINVPLGSFHPPLLDALAQRLIEPIEQGIDVLVADPAAYLAGKRFGLVCNTSSLTLDNRFLPDVLFNWAKGRDDGSVLTALFSPEHGLRGTIEAFGEVPTEDKSPWGCPVFSLHGKHKKPTPAMLKNLDVVVIALPDVGMRCYTYLSTIDLVLEACSEKKIAVVLLDPINPIASWGAQGPVLEQKHKSFLGCVEKQFLHGATYGALAKEVNKKYQAKLTVLASKQQQSATDGWAFKAPSPNLMSIDHLYAYPLTVLLEGTNYSEGRGTKYPFLQCGAPWVNAKELVDVLNGHMMPGIYFEPVTFIPKKMPGIAESPKHENMLCQGVFAHIVDHAVVCPAHVATVIIKELFIRYPEQSTLLRWGRTYGLDNLYGSDSLRKELVQEPSCGFPFALI